MSTWACLGHLWSLYHNCWLLCNPVSWMPIMLCLVGLGHCWLYRTSAYASPSPRRWDGRNAWDWGWEQVDCTPSSLLMGFSVLLLPFRVPSEPAAFCLLHHPLWWQLASDSWNEDSLLESTSVFLLSSDGASPTRPEPSTEADPNDEMSSCSKGVQTKSSHTCPVDRTKERKGMYLGLMSQRLEKQLKPPKVIYKLFEDRMEGL